MLAEPEQPQPLVDEDGQVRVFCDRPGERGVSNVIGDQAQVIAWIAALCDVAGLECDDAELPDSLVISIPAGS